MFSLLCLVTVAAAQLYPANIQGPTNLREPLYPIPVPFHVDEQQNTLNNRGPFQPVDPRQRRNERVAEPVDDVDLVIVGVVSGERNPEVPLGNDPNQRKVFQEGPGELNNVGKRQAINLGRAIRERYGNIVKDVFDPTNFVAQSSTGDSEQMTAQAINAGIFRPVGKSVFDPSVQWQPVPVSTQDDVLGVGRIRECPTVREVLRQIFSGQVPQVQEVLRREKRVVEYVRQNTGVQGTIDELAQVAENLRQLRVRNLPLPQWVEQPQIEGVDREELFQRIQAFRNAVEVACSVFQPCRQAVAGVLLNQIVQSIRNVQPRDQVNNLNNLNNLNNVNVDVNVITPDIIRVQSGLVVVTADVETILSVVRVLKLEQFNVKPSEAVILEVRASPVPSVRVVVTRPDEVNPEVRRFVIPNRIGGSRSVDCRDDFCPVESLVQRIRQEIPQDFQGPCNVRDCVQGRQPVVKVTEDLREVDIFANPKVSPKGVDCTQVRDKYPETACRELARSHLCVRNNHIRNVVCRRTCLCTQYEVFDVNQPRVNLHQ